MYINGISAYHNNEMFAVENLSKNFIEFLDNLNNLHFNLLISVKSY